MRYLITILALLISSFAARLNAGNDIKQMAEEAFGTSSYGILAIKNSGDTIVNIGSRHKLIPASNTKLITTGIAISKLGPDYKFNTQISYAGEIEDGTLNGDLYIVGGGDPTIGSKDSIAIPVEELFAKWKALIDKAGIKKINGNIVGDGRYFNGDIEEPSWQYEDIGTYYGTGGNGLCFYRNIQDFNVLQGKKPGTPLKITTDYPETPWMKYIYNCHTGNKGTGDQLYLYTTEFTPVAEMKGSFAIDRKYRTVHCSNKFGAFTCASYFAKYLKDNGLDITGSAADIDIRGKIRDLCVSNTGSKAAVDSNKLKVLGFTLSPSVARISYIVNQRSDNFYAETLFRQLGKQFSGSAEYSQCANTVRDILRDMGLNTEGYRQVDGSGLSKKNYISPAFFCNFLKSMMESDFFDKYIATLTSPGRGSESVRLKNESEQLRSRIFWKSGSMDGIQCFSGYIAPSEGGKEDTIIFSVMVNNCKLSHRQIKLTLDKIIASLANEN